MVVKPVTLPTQFEVKKSLSWAAAIAGTDNSNRIVNSLKYFI
jgi:hypothetical protein